MQIQDSGSRWFAWYHIGSQKKKKFIKHLEVTQHKLALVTAVYERQIQQKTIL